jgi:hypothetical protein
MASYLAKLIKNLEGGMNKKHKLKAIIFSSHRREGKLEREAGGMKVQQEHKKTSCKQTRIAKRILIPSFLLVSKRCIAFYELALALLSFLARD